MDFNWFFKFFKEKPRTYESDNRQESTNDTFRNSDAIPFHDGFSTIDNSFNPYQQIFFEMDEMFKKMLSYSSIEHEMFPNDVLEKKTAREELLRNPNEFLPFYGNQYGGSSFKQDYDHEVFSNDGFKKKTPREELLRDPNEALPFSGFQTESSIAFQDYDMDQVSRHGPQLYRISDVVPEHHFYKKFSSIRRIHLPDGVVEEHHVTSDSEGNSITTVRRSIGDKTHEVITHSDNKGVKETVENFKNLDKKEVVDFEKRLQNYQVPPVNDQLKLPTNDINPPPGDSSYLSLFKKFFGH